MKSNEWSPTEERDSKAISDVAGHILHSFCAGDHGFKGIPGTFFLFLLIKFIFNRSFYSMSHDYVFTN